MDDPRPRTAIAIVARYTAFAVALLAAGHVIAGAAWPVHHLSEMVAFVGLTDLLLYDLLRRRDRGLRQREERLLSAHERLQALADSAHSYTLIVDEAGVIHFANPTVELVIGVAPGASVGRVVTDFVAVDDRAALIEALGQAYRLRTSTGVPVMFRLMAAGPSAPSEPGPRHRWVQALIVCRLDDAAVGGLVLSGQDVTHLTQHKQFVTTLLHNAVAITRAPTVEAVAGAVLDAAVLATRSTLGVVYAVQPTAAASTPQEGPTGPGDPERYGSGERGGGERAGGADRSVPAGRYGQPDRPRPPDRLGHADRYGPAGGYGGLGGERGPGTLVALASTGPSDAARWPALPVDGPSLAAQAARSRQVVTVASAARSAALPRGAEAMGRGGVVYVPMLVGDRCVGVIGLGLEGFREVDGTERSTLLTFAHQGAMALERAAAMAAQAAALAAAGRAARRAALLHRATKAFSRAATEHEVLEAAVAAIDDAMHPQLVVAARCDGGELRVIAGRGHPAAGDAGPATPDAGPATPDGDAVPDSSALPAGHRRAALATAQDGRTRWFGASPADGAAGGVLALCVDGEVVGVLAVAVEGCGDEAERELVETVATLCVEALRRAGLLARAQREAQRYQELFDSYEALFRHHPQPMLVCDHERLDILAVNDAAVAEFGYRAEELTTMRVTDLLERGEVARILGIVHGEGFDPRRLQHISLVRLRRKDGSTFVADASGHDAAGFTGRLARVVVYSDQTARVEAEADRLELQERVLEVAEQERRRLAEDLHDGPVQDLAVVAMRLSALRRAAARPATGEALAAGLAQSEQAVIDAIDQLRGVMMRLYPPALDEMSLAEAIAGAVAESPGLATLSVRVEDHLDQPVAPAAKAVLYRVVLEALQNVRKHAGTDAAVVELRDDGDVLDVRVSDHGVGIEEPERLRPRHLGLPSMRDRLALLGGSLAVERVSASGGTSVRARLPHRPLHACAPCGTTGPTPTVNPAIVTHDTVG